MLGSRGQNAARGGGNDVVAGALGRAEDDATMDKPNTSKGGNR